MWRENYITIGLGMRKIVILLTAVNDNISLKKTGVCLILFLHCVLEQSWSSGWWPCT